MDSGRLYYPINLVLRRWRLTLRLFARMALDPMVLPLPRGRSSKVFAGTALEVMALSVQPTARCQWGPHAT